MYTCHNMYVRIYIYIRIYFIKYVYMCISSDTYIYICIYIHIDIPAFCEVSYSYILMKTKFMQFLVHCSVWGSKPNWVYRISSNQLPNGSRFTPISASTFFQSSTMHRCLHPRAKGWAGERMFLRRCFPSNDATHPWLRCNILQTLIYLQSPDHHAFLGA